MSSLKIFFVGDCGAGKSSIIHRYLTNEFDRQIGPTFTAHTETKSQHIGDRTHAFELWDIAGGEDAAKWCAKADSAAVVFDSSDRESFSRLGTWVDCLRINNFPPPPFVILANKSDLECSVPADELSEFRRDRGWPPYYEVSAMSGRNVMEAMLALMESAVDRTQREMKPEENPPVTDEPVTRPLPVYSPEEENKRSRCCQI
jgi:small GTP-binding protein